MLTQASSWALRQLGNGHQVTRNAWLRLKFLVIRPGDGGLITEVTPGEGENREEPWGPRAEDLGATDWGLMS